MIGKKSKKVKKTRPRPNNVGSGDVTETLNPVMESQREESVEAEQQRLDSPIVAAATGSDEQASKISHGSSSRESSSFEHQYEGGQDERKEEEPPTQ